VISRPVLALCVGLGLATGFGWAFTLLQILLGLILGTMVGGTAVTNVMEMPAQAPNVRRICQLLIGTAAATVLTPDIVDAMLVLLPAVISIPVTLHLADTVRPPVQIADGASYAALLACLGVGAVISFVSSRLGVLNPWILMPMVVGVVLVAFGFSLMPLPQPLLIAAQVGIGFSLGTRLDIADLVHVPKITVGALASGLALIAIMTYVALPFLLTWIDADRLSVVLGLAPGGLGEMIATSKAVGGATALVAGFQFVRSFITNMLVPPIVSRVFKSDS
jgi:membrane AbrB-like protein